MRGLLGFIVGGLVLTLGVVAYNWPPSSFESLEGLAGAILIGSFLVGGVIGALLTVAVTHAADSSRRRWQEDPDRDRQARS